MSASPYVTADYTQVVGAATVTGYAPPCGQHARLNPTLPRPRHWTTPSARSLAPTPAAWCFP